MAPQHTTDASTAGRKGAPMGTDPTSEFLARRAAWVAKGRPADPTDPHWASVLASQDEPPPRFVEPLVSFG